MIVAKLSFEILQVAWITPIIDHDLGILDKEIPTEKMQWILI